MSEQNITNQTKLQNLWMREGVWYRSPFVQDFLKRARAQYPAPQNGNKAAWPDDEEGIGQNLAYFFTGNLLKIDKILCSLLSDQEAVDYLSQAREITVLDMACGAGTASVGFVDFIDRALNGGVIQRQTPLTISFLVNDLNEPCVAAARKSLDLVQRILHTRNRNILIGSVRPIAGSVSEVETYLRDSSAQFDLLFLCNAFDQILVYGNRVTEKNPHSVDPIARAQPCDRPALLASLFQKLGAFANTYFSRVVLLQESRHYSLISVALPDRSLKLTRTWMVQETDRPDVEKPTMNVRFGYCGCRYGFSNQKFSPTPELQPLETQELPVAAFSDSATVEWFDEELSVND